MGIGYLSDMKYTDTLDNLIIAFCKDYSRRESAIRECAHSRRTIMEYKYLNARLREAACEIVGEDGDAYINEIGGKIGYANSSVNVSESTYKQLKKEVKVNIAKKLHLIG